MQRFRRLPQYRRSRGYRSHRQRHRSRYHSGSLTKQLGHAILHFCEHFMHPVLLVTLDLVYILPSARRLVESDGTPSAPVCLSVQLATFQHSQWRIQLVRFQHLSESSLYQRCDETWKRAAHQLLRP